MPSTFSRAARHVLAACFSGRSRYPVMARIHPWRAHVGGEGTLLLNAAPSGYWLQTLFAVAGRPLPPALISIVYITYVVTLTVLSENYDQTHRYLQVDKFMLTSVGSALAFLAVFRSNAAYERWWDGRKKWGMVINRTRDLSRQSIVYMGDSVHAEAMVRYTIAFAVTMKRHLRFERELHELIKNSVLTQEQVGSIKASTCPGRLRAILWTAALTAAAPVSPRPNRMGTPIHFGIPCPTTMPHSATLCACTTHALAQVSEIQTAKHMPLFVCELPASNRPRYPSD